MSAKRILVAEDDPDMLELVALAVARRGVDVVTATSGDELLQRIAEAGPFDLVITDVSMPWMTGLQVIHSARTAGMRCPVIVMTALRDDRTSYEVDSLGAGVQRLYKPFSIRDLEAALDRALGGAPLGRA